MLRSFETWVNFVYLNFIDLLCLRHDRKFVVALCLSDLPKWTVSCSTLFFDRIFCQVLPSCFKKVSSTWKDDKWIALSVLSRLTDWASAWPRKRHFRLSGTPKVNFCLSRGTHKNPAGYVRVRLLYIMLLLPY